MYARIFNSGICLTFSFCVGSFLKSKRYHLYRPSELHWPWTGTRTEWTCR